MSTQDKGDPSLLVREVDATSSLSRRNFIGATAAAAGGPLTGGAALAGERTAKEALAAARPSGLEKRTQVGAGPCTPIGGGIDPDPLLIPFVAIFHSLPGRKVLGFRH